LCVGGTGAVVNGSPVLTFVFSTPLFFLALYSLKFSFLPITAALLVWPLYAFCLWLRHRTRPLNLNRYIVVPFVWITCLTIYSTGVSTIIGGMADFSVPYNFLVWLLIFLPVSLVLAMICRRGNGEARKPDIYEIIVIVVTIQAVFIYLSFFYGTVRDFVSTILVDEAISTDFATRVKGFSSGGGAGLSLIQGVGAAISFLLFTIRRRAKYVIFCVLMLGSTLFTGRTGLIFFVLFFFMYFPYCLFTHKIRFRTLIPVVSILFTAALFFYYGYLSEENRSLIEGSVITRTFDIFESAGNKELMEHGAMSAISEMYEVPNTTRGILFGDGLFLVDGVDYAGDPGYVKELFYFGLLGCLGYYGYFIYLMIQTVRFSETNAEKVFVLIFYILYFFVETKEPFLMKTNIIHHVLYFSVVLGAQPRRLASSVLQKFLAPSEEVAAASRPS
jgi:hypothetical protein